MLLGFVLKLETRGFWMALATAAALQVRRGWASTGTSVECMLLLPFHACLPCSLNTCQPVLPVPLDGHAAARFVLWVLTGAVCCMETAWVQCQRSAWKASNLATNADTLVSYQVSQSCMPICRLVVLHHIVRACLSQASIQSAIRPKPSTHLACCIAPPACTAHPNQACIFLGFICHFDWNEEVQRARALLLAGGSGVGLVAPLLPDGDDDEDQGVPGNGAAAAGRKQGGDGQGGVGDEEAGAGAWMAAPEEQSVDELQRPLLPGAANSSS